MSGADAEQIERAVESATFDLYTGTEDHLLRRLEIHIVFGLANATGVDPELASVAGADMSIEIGIANPNEPVEVSAPAGALPFESLGG